MIRLVATALVALTLAGCGLAGIGGRRWVVTVENGSARPLTLVVARDEMPIAQVVGTANPSVVPPGATVDVTFGIPVGEDWAIFVNPAPNRGPLVTAHDVPPDANGRMPFQIGIDWDGTVYSSMAGRGLPGWFGN